MKLDLTSQQEGERTRAHEFAREAIAPNAAQFEDREKISHELISELGQQGYLGGSLSPTWGGGGWDATTTGLVHEQIGAACSSTRSLLTVQSMVGRALERWGTDESKTKWLPRLASGQAIAAFALTEAEVGSDAEAVQTTATLVGDEYTLAGTKLYVSFGQIADVFLVAARCEGRVEAFLVDGSSPGLTRRPTKGFLGLRASQLAEIDLSACKVPREHRLGGGGLGFCAAVATALEMGRYSVAWGCVGIAQACLQASIHRSRERVQFGVPIGDHQLVQKMLADMVTGVWAARLTCLQVGQHLGQSSLADVSIAKYLASTTALRTASDAIQIHGAAGLAHGSAVARHFRDAKTMEIIEGSSQIQQLLIGRYGAAEEL